MHATRHSGVAAPRALAALALVSLLLLGACQPARAQGADAAALLAFRATFTNGEELLPSWGGSQQDPCSGWAGVSCTGSGGAARVTSL